MVFQASKKKTLKRFRRIQRFPLYPEVDKYLLNCILRHLAVFQIFPSDKVQLLIVPIIYLTECESIPLLYQVCTIGMYMNLHHSCISFIFHFFMIYITWIILLFIIYF